MSYTISIKINWFLFMDASSLIMIVVSSTCYGGSLVAFLVNFKCKRDLNLPISAITLFLILTKGKDD